jgi:hypothetical protein
VYYYFLNKKPHSSVGNVRNNMSIGGHMSQEDKRSPMHKEWTKYKCIDCGKSGYLSPEGV